MIETGLYQLLATDPRVNSIVGTKVFYKDVPENTTVPYVVFSMITGQSEFTLDGPDPLTTRRYQFSAWSGEAFAARKLIEAVKDVIEGYSGPLPDGTLVQSSIQQDDGDHPREVGPGGFITGAYVDVEIGYIPT